VIARIARDVIGAEVEEERMTCKKGCSRDGISKLWISKRDQLPVLSKA